MTGAKKTSEEEAQPGLTLEIELNLVDNDSPLEATPNSARGVIESAFDRQLTNGKIDTKVMASYHPLAHRSKAMSPTFTFEGKMTPGTPRIILPESNTNKDGPLMVLVLIPTVEAIR